MFSMTARVCTRMSSVVVPMAATSAPAIRLAGRRERVPETNRKSPARLMWGYLPRGVALPATTVALTLDWVILRSFVDWVRA
ncbi:hypothetical protein G6F40_017542 [Rhizopus arrhizus]|nr:hypothetical protein G6F40_017542 [Rhizopus arrhizus]